MTGRHSLLSPSPTTPPCPSLVFPAHPSGICGHSGNNRSVHILDELARGRVQGNHIPDLSFSPFSLSPGVWWLFCLAARGRGWKLGKGKDAFLSGGLDFGLTLRQTMTASLMPFLFVGKQHEKLGSKMTIYHISTYFNYMFLFLKEKAGKAMGKGWMDGWKEGLGKFSELFTLLFLILVIITTYLFTVLIREAS